MTTRAELLQDIDTWLARDDLSSGGSQDTFLRIAQSIIDREVRLKDQETTVNLSLVQRTTPLPSDYLTLISISIDSVLDRNIEYLTPERIRESPVWQNQGGSNSDREQVTFAYTLENNNLTVAPAPSATNPLSVDLVYVSRLSRLVNGGDTNYLLTNYYDVYLWCVLAQAAIFIEDSELENKYGRLYERAIESLNINERRGRFAGSALISTGSPRRIV